MSTPPMKPMWFFLVALAAATPARYEDCSSWKTRSATLGALTVASSMMPKVIFGNLAATSLTAGPYTKPTPMIGL